MTESSANFTTPHFDRSALLLIDMQRDFAMGRRAVPGTAEVIPALSRLVAGFRDSNRPIVHVVRFYEPGGSDADTIRRAEVKAGVQLVAPGSDGAGIVEELLPHGSPGLDDSLLLSGTLQEVGRDEFVLYKPRWSAFYRTSLEHWLHRRHIDTVVVAGCNLPNCPRATLFDATERDFRAVLAADAVSQATAERLSDLSLIGVELWECQGIVAALSNVGSGGRDP